VFSGDVLGRNWDKNLKNFAPCFLHQRILLPPNGFLGLEIYGWKWGGGGGGGLALFSLSLCLPLKVALFFLLFHFFYMQIHIFPIETIIINALKGRKPDRKPYHPYGFRNPYKTINKWIKQKFFHV
jgi:hypothetical protein